MQRQQQGFLVLETAVHARAADARLLGHRRDREAVPTLGFEHLKTRNHQALERVAAALLSWRMGDERHGGIVTGMHDRIYKSLKSL
jgi:hypothetical protein